MSKLDLKAAMDSLQVKKPLKLAARQPQFQAPPQVAEPTQVNTETQVDLPTQVPAIPEVPTSPPVSAQTQVETDAEVSTPAKVAIQTTVANEPLVSTATPVTPQTDVLPTSVNEQDSSVHLETQAAPKLHNGYTRLPNSILMRMAAGDLLRSEMQILLIIARFTISYQKRHAPLSKTVLERQTGLRGPAVLQAVSALIAKGLVEKIAGDQYRPNQLGLVFSDEWDFFPKDKRATDNTSTSKTPEVPIETQSTKETPVSAKNPAPVPVPTPTEVSGATHFKDIETNENKHILSHLPNKLRHYFADLKPARKRESEWNAFQDLLTEFSAEDIVDCLSYIEERGIGHGDTLQPCHSPMAFLSKGIAEILNIVRARRQKLQDRSERERLQSTAQRIRLDDEAREALEWATKERAFLDTFPSESQQLSVLAGILHNLPFGPNSQAGRAFGISKWWEEQNKRR